MRIAGWQDRSPRARPFARGALGESRFAGIWEWFNSLHAKPDDALIVRVPGDFIEDVKSACAREAVTFDNDIFNERAE